MCKNGNDGKTFSLTGPDFFSCAAGASTGAGAVSDILYIFFHTLNWLSYQHGRYTPFD